MPNTGIIVYPGFQSAAGAAILLRKYKDAVVCTGSARSIIHTLSNPQLKKVKHIFLISIGAYCEKDELIKKLKALFLQGIKVTWYYHYSQYEWLANDLKGEKHFTSVIKPKGWVTEIVADHQGIQNDFVTKLLKDEKKYVTNKDKGFLNKYPERAAFIESESQRYLFYDDKNAYPEAIRFLATGAELDRKSRNVARHFIETGGRVLIGKSEKISSLKNICIQSGKDPFIRVLIQGETGTGKETVARLIHNASNRHREPFIPASCANFNENLMESELFGHVKGAFTSSVENRDGKFKRADGGTLFLDEVGELPPNLQARLLRVLQEGRFTPLGSAEDIHVDVRVIAATNRDLINEIKEKRFREDLYFRFAQMVIKTPSLRDIPEDISEIADSIIRNFCMMRDIQKKPKISDKTLACLKSYSWPGNVRELENVLAKAIVQNKLDDVESILKESEIIYDSDSCFMKIKTIVHCDKVQADYCKKVLEHCNGKKTKAMNMIGLSINTFNKYLNL